MLMGAEALTKIFPMMVTAVHVIQRACSIGGALRASRRSPPHAARRDHRGHDTRPVVREQVESPALRFVEPARDRGMRRRRRAATRAQTEEFYQKQRRGLGKRLAQTDVVITTALVPGQRAPILTTPRRCAA
jgi:NAD(P) transhydrogenase subunit alpha